MPHRAPASMPALLLQSQFRVRIRVIAGGCHVGRCKRRFPGAKWFQGLGANTAGGNAVRTPARGAATVPPVPPVPGRAQVPPQTVG